MRAILKEPGRLPQTIDLGPELDDLQAAVGGHIEQCMSFGSGDDRVIVWCDEDYMARRSPLNFFRPSDGHAVLGNVVVVGTRRTLQGEDSAALTDDQLAMWLWLMSWLYFRTLESPLGMQLCSAFGVPPDEGMTLSELFSKLSDRYRALASAVMLSHARLTGRVPRGAGDFGRDEFDLGQSS